MRFIYNRCMMFIWCMFDICLLSAANYWITRWARHLIFEMGNHSDDKIHINWQSLVQIALILLLSNNTVLTLGQYKNYPFSASLISYVTLLYHNISFFTLIHSQYIYKYYFNMWIYTTMTYFYMSSYPNSNTTLTMIVYLTFTVYQLSYHLFKFSFQFEQIIYNVQQGNLSTMLSVRLQNALHHVHSRRFVREQAPQQEELRQ